MEIPKITNEGTDCHFILNFLSDGLYHNIIDIMLARGETIRNWAVRSRIAQLRPKLKPLGFDIQSEIDFNRQSKYRLIKLEKQTEIQKELFNENR